MKTMLLAASAALALALPASAQDPSPSISGREAQPQAEPVGQKKTPAPAPSEIVAAAPKADWVAIPAEDLLVMTLAPDADGKPRTVVIQLMPAPFSQGWVHNIRLFARAKWFDNISVNRVQDNYVTQWGDPNYDNPEATGKPKPLPQGLKVMGESEYIVSTRSVFQEQNVLERAFLNGAIAGGLDMDNLPDASVDADAVFMKDRYAPAALIGLGWPMGLSEEGVWPTHCYGMVGVGRNYSPDTGSGAELYTVIGHAPRHLDRNIALVGRVIEGMQYLSSLPRGSGALGFYTTEEAGKRTPILSARVASDLAPAEQPAFEYLSTESATFATYAEAIANRRDPFFIAPAGGADICNIRVPVRRVAE
jgi:cyclophilin family peptidyl-prolyl cis-trans isomerase